MAYDATDFVVTETPAHPSVSQPERIAQVRAAILAHRRDFNMNDSTTHECGTPACIHGFAKSIWREPRLISSQAMGAHLGLTSQQTVDLFHMSAPHMHLSPGAVCRWDATAEEAAAVLDHYIQTGKIDWSVA